MEALYRHRITRLEDHLQDLTADRDTLASQLETERSESASRVTALQQQLETEVQEVIQRQDLVRLLPFLTPLPAAWCHGAFLQLFARQHVAGDLLQRLACTLHIISSDGVTKIPD